jgi:hypothetical protein
MTTEQKIIRAKVGLLELAKQLGNVSQACKMMGYSRDPRQMALREAVDEEDFGPIRIAPLLRRNAKALRATVLARQKAQDELAGLYRERSIQRARAAERDFSMPLQ